MASPAKNIKSPSRPIQLILRRDATFNPQAQLSAKRPNPVEPVTVRPMKRTQRSAVKSAPELKKVCTGAGKQSKPQGLQKKSQELISKPQGVQTKPHGIQSEPDIRLEVTQGIQSVLPLPVYIPIIYKPKPGDTKPEEACTEGSQSEKDKQRLLPPPGFLIFITSDSKRTDEFILPDENGAIQRDDNIKSEECSSTNPEDGNNTKPEDGNNKNLAKGNNTNPEEGNNMIPEEGNTKTLEESNNTNPKDGNHKNLEEGNKTNPEEGNNINPEEGNNTNIILPRFRVRNQCNQHEALFKQQDEGLPKIGDVFKSPEQFIDYAANNAKDWFYYHTITDSFNPEKGPGFKKNNGTLVTFTCKMNLQEQSASTGPKSRVPKKCPSSLSLARSRGEADYKVRDVCHHHSHRLTSVFNHHPYFYAVPEDIKQEIVDLAQLNVDQRLVLRYIYHKIRDLAKDNVDHQMKNLVSRIVPYKISVPEQKVAQLVQKYFRVPSKYKTAMKTMPPEKMKAKIEYINKAFDFSATYNKTNPEVGKLSSKLVRVEENSTNVIQLTISYEEMEHCMDQIEFVDCSNIKQETATTNITHDRVNTKVSTDVGSDSETVDAETDEIAKRVNTNVSDVRSDSETEDAETDEIATDIEYLDDTVYADSDDGLPEVPANEDEHDYIDINQVTKTNYRSSVESKFMMKNAFDSNKNMVSLLKHSNIKQRPIYVVSETKTDKKKAKLNYDEHDYININQVIKTEYESSVESKCLKENVFDSSLLKHSNNKQKPIDVVPKSIASKKTAKLNYDEQDYININQVIKTEYESSVESKCLKENVFDSSLLKHSNNKQKPIDVVPESIANKKRAKFDKKRSESVYSGKTILYSLLKNKTKKPVSDELASVKEELATYDQIQIKQKTSTKAASELSEPKVSHLWTNKVKTKQDTSTDAAAELPEPKDDLTYKIAKSFLDKYAESITRSDTQNTDKKKKPNAFQYSRCHTHGDFPEYKAEGLPQNGDVFNSKDEFLEYVAKHAKDWLFTYALTDCRATRTIQDINAISSYYMFACKYNRRRRNQEHKYKGLRVHKKRIPNHCPAGLMIKRDRGFVDFTVRQACHHHNHEITEQLFKSILSIPRELRIEIADLAKLNVDVGLVQAYIQSKVDLPEHRLTKLVYNHFRAGIRSNKTLSPERYKELLEKVKYLKEHFCIPNKRRPRKIITENEPRKYPNIQYEQKIRRKIAKVLGSVKGIINFEPNEVKEEMAGGIANNKGITSIPKYITFNEPVTVISGNTVEAHDRKLIQSVKHMQKRTGCIDNINNGGAHRMQNKKLEIQYIQFPAVYRDYQHDDNTAEQIDIDQEVHIMSENDIIPDDHFGSEVLTDCLTTECDQKIVYHIPESGNKIVKQNIESSLKSKSIDDNYEGIQDIQSVKLEYNEIVDDIQGIESVQTEEYVEYIQDIESDHNEEYIEDIEWVHNEEYVEDIKSVHNEEYVEDIESVYGEEYIEDIESVHNEEYVDDIQGIESVKSEEFVEDMESVKTKEIVRAVQDTQTAKTVKYKEQVVQDIQSANTEEYIEQSNHENNEDVYEVYDENGENYRIMYKDTNEKDMENENQGVKDLYGAQCDSLETLTMKKTEMQADTTIDFTRETKTLKEVESEFLREHAGKIVFSASTRGRPKVPLDESIINRYNIEFYISLGGVGTCIEQLAANMNISSLELLKHMYQGKAVLKMLTGRTGKNRKTVHLTFVPLTMAFPFENKYIDGLQEYKSLCSKYSDVVVSLENTINSMSTELKTLKEELDTAKVENERLLKLTEGQTMKKQTDDETARDKKKIKKLEEVICLMINRYKSNSSVLYV